MTRTLRSIEAFSFSSQFEAPTASPDTVTMSVKELSAVIADTREATAKLVRDEHMQARLRELNTVADRLNAALRTLVSLAQLLEHAAIDETDRARALESVRHLAKSLIDGQGELFDTEAHIHTSESISEQSDPSV